MRRHPVNKRAGFIVALMLLSLPVLGYAVDSTRKGSVPLIAIVIDDMGERWSLDQRIVAMDGALTCAFFSFGSHTRLLAQRAHAAHKEVMLHLPMQPIDNAIDPAHESAFEFGPSDLVIDLSEKEVKSRVNAQLALIPHVRGVNNHQGSLLTRHPVHMQWVMEALQADARPLFFVDSLTSAGSVAEQIAAENGVPVVHRDVFLDHTPTPEKIAASFERLVRIAKKNGYAVAIGHPLPATVDFLENALPHLSDWGVELVTVSSLLARRAWPE